MAARSPKQVRLQGSEQPWGGPTTLQSAHFLAAIWTEVTDAGASFNYLGSEASCRLLE